MADIVGSVRVMVGFFLRFESRNLLSDILPLACHLDAWMTGLLPGSMFNADGARIRPPEKELTFTRPNSQSSDPKNKAARERADLYPPQLTTLGSQE